jgi:hypothetical protein
VRGCIDPRLLGFAASWMRMVSFTPRPLYPRQPLKGMFGWLQILSWQSVEERILDLTGTLTPVAWPYNP